MASTTVDSRIPVAIQQRLNKLRAAVSRFLWIEGLGRVLALTVALAVTDVAVDRIFKMDLAQRGIMLIVIILLLLFAIYRKLCLPLSKKMTDDALLLQVEDKNRELHQSVISAAQLARGTDYEQQGVSQSMVDATIRYGSEMADVTRFGNAIDSKALLRNWVLLLVGLFAIGALAWGVKTSSFWATWFNRNVLLADEQWPRKTTLVIDGAADNVMSLLRGEDHNQIVRIADQSEIKNVDVVIEFDDGNVRTRQKMRRTGDLEHTLIFRNLSNVFKFRARGGDHITDWVTVDLVDAPSWSELSMQVELPEYTSAAAYELPSGGGPHSVLEGSSIKVRAVANKNLNSAAVKLGDQQKWDMQNRTGNVWELVIPPDQLVGGKYSFDLTDQMNLRSSRPATFSVKVKPDRPPVVRATLLGISGLVVPRARVPVSFSASDEFQLTGMLLEYGWNNASDDRSSASGQLDVKELDPNLATQLGQSEVEGVAVVDLESLVVPEGVSLKLKLVASDNNTQTGPGSGSSREFLLRVVSEEELRADLLRREIEQRKAFELVLGNQEKLKFDIQAIADALSQPDLPFTPGEALDQMRDAQRRQKLVGTNVSRVADRFEEFLVEAINNRLNEAESAIESSQSIDVRFNEQIIQPIRALDSAQIVSAGQLIELAGRDIVYDADANTREIDRQAFLKSLINVISKQQEVIEVMQSILASMKDSETYQEVVNKVIEIKRTEESIRDKAREKRDEGSGVDIFDEDEGMFDKDEDDSAGGLR